MYDEADHVIHSQNGRLTNQPGATTTRADVARMVAKGLALDADAPALVIHFHGGLVDKPAGLEIARKLHGTYSTSKSYPIFMVWQSGLFESIKNNLADIRDDKLFQQLVKKVSRWVMEALPAQVGLKGAGTKPDVALLEAEFDAYFQGARELPTAFVANGPVVSLKSATIPPDELALSVKIQAALAQDYQFRNDMESIHQSIATDKLSHPEAKASGVGATVTAQSEIAPSQVDAAFNVTPATKGTFALARIALLIAKIVIAVIGRYRGGRAHGAYTTIVEEILAAVYIDKVGGIIWRQMKKDTADAFVESDDAAGTILLEEIAAQQELKGKKFARLVLVGHSTGAIYISHFLEKARQLLGETPFEVIFLAPAITYEQWARTVLQYTDIIVHMRRYAMTDENESKDRLVSIVYPKSLLYFVSGLMEFSEGPNPVRLPDAPLVGMQRYSIANSAYSGPDFADIASVERHLDGMAGGSVWSISANDALKGARSSAVTHGSFDDDPITVESLRTLVEEGF